MSLLLQSLTLSSALELQDRLTERIKQLRIENDINTLLSELENRGYYISIYEHDNYPHLTMNVNVCASSYDKFDDKPSNYDMELDDDQDEWYDELYHELEDTLPLDAKISNWCYDADWDDPISGSGIGHMYLYYKKTGNIDRERDCMVVCDDGKVLSPNDDNIVELNKLIAIDKAIVVYTYEQ